MGPRPPDILTEVDTELEVQFLIIKHIGTISLTKVYKESESRAIYARHALS